MSDTNKQPAGRNSQVENNPSWLDHVREQVASLRFGTVQITIHDYRVVQVEKSEKLRFDSPRS